MVYMYHSFLIHSSAGNPICKTEKETQMYRTDFWTLWEKARVGCFKRTALKHVYYLGWNRSPAQVGCMRQVLGPGALGRPRGIGWRGRWEGRSGWGIHIYPWLVHVNVWQKPLQYCKVISLQLIKKKKKRIPSFSLKMMFQAITKSFHELMLIAPAVPTPVSYYTDWLRSDRDRVSFNSLKHDCVVTSFSGNDFPSWLYLPAFVNTSLLSSVKNLF